MNRNFTAKCAAILATLAIAPGVFALPTLTITRTTGHGTGPGGEFTLAGDPSVQYAADYAAVARAGGNIQSFCLERNEYITLGATYQYTVGDGAILGGLAGGNPDPLSVGTAWLYSRFAQGTLSGYNYTAGSGRNASANALQDAIWVLEQELTMSEAGFLASVNPFLVQVRNVYASLAASRAHAAVGGPVRVLNLVNAQGAPQQSQVVYIRPPDTNLVPDGGLTMLMLGASLAGFAAIRRRLAN